MSHQPLTDSQVQEKSLKTTCVTITRENHEWSLQRNLHCCDYLDLIHLRKIVCIYLFIVKAYFKINIQLKTFVFIIIHGGTCVKVVLIQ